MARGWESKSVDEQIAAAEEERESRRYGRSTPGQRAHAERRDALMLNRSRTLQALQAACDSRYRGLLEATMEHLDREIAALDAATEGAEGRSRQPTPED